MTKANNHFPSSGAAPKFHEHPASYIIYSEGVKNLSDSCQCYWLLELITFYQTQPEIKKHKYQCWDLLRAHDSVFDIVASDNHNHIIVAHQVAHVNFPFDAATIWVIDGNVLVLPNEYINCHSKPSRILSVTATSYSSLN